MKAPYPHRCTLCHGEGWVETKDFGILCKTCFDGLKRVKECRLRRE